ncbi:MAG: retron St85 family RNA-directed DNA polymerase [Bryobacteraceae bacterium]|jgi:hypothetical protein
MSLDILRLAATYLGYDLTAVRDMYQMAPKTYRRFCIKKSSGGHRAIYHPSGPTKALQYALINLLLDKLPVHSSASAYHRGCSIVANARAHASFAYSVRLDFSNFFPSIRPEDLLCRVTRVFGDISPESAEFVTSALFVRYASGQMGLAVGAPSSPAASNATMIDIDQALSAFALARGGCYTRYADDLVFSTNVKSETAGFALEVQHVLAGTASPSLRLNVRKTKYSSRASRRIVTGLVITPEGTVSVGRHNKRFVRKLLFDLSNDVLDKRSATYLKGYLAFLQDVEPDILNKLALRYGGAVVDRAKRGPARPIPADGSPSGPQLA